MKIKKYDILHLKDNGVLNPLCDLQSTLFLDDEERVFVKIKQFGYGAVYSLIKVKCIKKLYRILSSLKDTKTPLYGYLSVSCNDDNPILGPQYLMEGKYYTTYHPDNLMIFLQEMLYEDILSLVSYYNHKWLDNMDYHCGFTTGDNPDNIVPPLNIDIAYVTSVNDSNRILLTGKGEWMAAHKLPFNKIKKASKFKGILINPSRNNLWYYLSSEEYFSIKSIECLTVMNVNLVDPRFKERISQVDEFNFSGFENILESIPFLSENLHFNVVFPPINDSRNGLFINTENMDGSSKSYILSWDDLDIHDLMLPKFKYLDLILLASRL